MPKHKARQGEPQPSGKAARGASKARGQEIPPLAALEEAPKKGPAPGMDGRSKSIVVGLMGVLLFVFILIAFLAPDTARPDGRPDGSTVVWRLLLLLVPLAIMYGLLWGEKLLNYVKR